MTTLHSGEEVIPVMATHIATIGKHDISGYEELIAVIKGFSFDDVHDNPIEEVPYGYLVLAEAFLLCGASVIYNSSDYEYTVVIQGDIEKFVSNFNELMEAQAVYNEQAEL